MVIRVKSFFLLISAVLSIKAMEKRHDNTPSYSPGSASSSSSLALSDTKKQRSELEIEQQVKWQRITALLPEVVIIKEKKEKAFDALLEAQKRQSGVSNSSETGLANGASGKIAAVEKNFKGLSELLNDKSSQFGLLVVELLQIKRALNKNENTSEIDL